MTNTTVPCSDIGRAHFEKLDNWLQNPRLLAGSSPEPWTYPYLIGANQTLKEGHVVGFDASGFIVPAVHGGDTPITPIGVMTMDLTTASGETTTKAAIYRSGCFNVNALTFDASFNTAALKTGAFEGAPSPTTITIRDRPTGAPGT